MSLASGISLKIVATIVEVSFKILFPIYALFMIYWLFTHSEPTPKTLGADGAGKIAFEYFVINFVILVGLPGVLLTIAHFKLYFRFLAEEKSKFVETFSKDDLRIIGADLHSVFRVEGRDKDSGDLYVSLVWDNDQIVPQETGYKMTESQFNKFDETTFLKKNSA